MIYKNCSMARDWAISLLTLLATCQIHSQGATGFRFVDTTIQNYSYALMMTNSLGKMYKELGTLGAKNVVVFLDACFSGSLRGNGMLVAARGVALKPKTETPQGNMVVFSAATGDETAYPYKEKGHGLFTYFLLKKLQESKGDCTVGELGEYIQTNIRQQSVVVNRKSQTPTVISSTSFGDSWKNLKLR